MHMKPPHATPVGRAAPTAAVSGSRVSGTRAGAPKARPAATAAPPRALAAKAGRKPFKTAGGSSAPLTAEGADELELVFASVARYFGLLAEPTRLKILHAICQSEQSVSAIVAATGATQTNVSRHLALLHRAGVVARRRAGNTVHYQVADPELIVLCRTVCVQIAGQIDASTPLRDELLDFAGRR